MLKHLTALKLPLTTCTIYNPRFDQAQQQTMCETGLSALNDVIVTESAKVKSFRSISSLNPLILFVVGNSYN